MPARSSSSGASTADSASVSDPDVELVADADSARAGRTVRARLDAGARVAGFVGDPDDPAVAELVADVIRPTQV